MQCHEPLPYQVCRIICPERSGNPCEQFGRFGAREVTGGRSRERNRRYGAREVTGGRSRERNKRHDARELTGGRSREQNRRYGARELTGGRSRERNRRYGAREVTGIIDDGRLTGRVPSLSFFPRFRTYKKHPLSPSSFQARPRHS